jgi:hypothetical protein
MKESEMMNMTWSRTRIVFSIWILALVAITSVSMALGARASTTAFLVVLAATPMGVALVLGFTGARRMTTRELIYAVENPKKTI